MSICEQAISYLAIAAGTWFWFWYLINEIERYKGRRTPRWYEREVWKWKTWEGEDDGT